MKRLCFITFLLLCSCFGVTGQDRISCLLDLLKSNSSDYVFVVAHRGAWRLAPENSIPSIEKATEMGIDMVEIDIQKTKDGNFVLMHDGSIDRTTNGKGNISGYTVAELKQFQLRYSDGELSSERIPTLEEALLACKGKLLVNIDKGGDYLKEIIPIIRKTDTEDHVVLKGRAAAVAVKKQLEGYENILYMPIVDLDTNGAIDYVNSFLSDFKLVAIEVGFKTDQFEQLSYLSEIAKTGSRIWINTLWESLCGGHEDEKAMSNPDANWGWVLDKQATIIQTDRPSELIEYLLKKGRRNIRGITKE